MNITAAEVNKLRQFTGAGMMDSKKALQEADGDFDKAVEILRKAGQKVAAKRAENATSEGIVLAHVNDTKTSSKVLAFACETEPVAKVADFVNLANDILVAAVKADAKTMEETMGLSLENGLTVEASITDLIGKIGEKLVISSFEHIEGEQVVVYIHSNQKAAGVIAFESVNGTDLSEVGKDVAMQVVAMKPIGLDKDNVDPTLVEKEIEIGKEQARAEGKPEAMLEKIALGKLNKFYKEQTLLNQEFVKDGSITIAQLLEKTLKGLKIKSFSRIFIG